MKAAFADTFCWIALTDPEDAAYERAHRFNGDIVTIDEVLGEYLTFFSGAPSAVRHKAAVNVQAILQDPAIRVIPQSRESFNAGFELYRARPDKSYSRIDCISMQAMRREGLTEVLTSDRHFEQEFFRLLLRDV